MDYLKVGLAILLFPSLSNSLSFSPEHKACSGSLEPVAVCPLSTMLTAPSFFPHFLLLHSLLAHTYHLAYLYFLEVLSSGNALR